MKKNNHQKKILSVATIAAFIILLLSSQLMAATYYSKASGDWNSASTWGTGCGSGTGSVPGVNDNVIICSTYTVTINTNVNCTAINVNSGGTLICNSNVTVTLSGATVVSGIFNMSAGMYTTTNSFTISGIMNMSGGTLNLTNNTTNANLNINGVFNLSGGEVSIAHFTYIQNSGIFNLSGTALYTAKRDVVLRNTKGIINMNGGKVVFQGNVISNNTIDEFNQQAGSITFEGTFSWENAGVYNATGGEAIFNGYTKLNYIDTTSTWHFFDLTINTGKTLYQFDAKNIDVRGDWQNNGTFLHNNRKVTLSGDIAQNISGDSVTTFSALTINNSSSTGITLHRSATIALVLTLNDGYVYTDSVNLIIVINNATSTEGSGESFISGPMKKIGNDPFVFPVGSAGFSNIWARLEMVNDSNFRYYNASTEFTCQYHNSEAPYNSKEKLSGTMDHVSHHEYWDLERTYDIANNAQCNVRLYWEDAKYSGIGNKNNLILAHYNKTKGYYEDLLGVSNGNISGSIVSTIPLKIFSPFTFASTTPEFITPLPIELLHFEARQNQQFVDLYWSTASEINNDFFSIEKSEDGINFNLVGTTRGAGNSTRIIDYYFKDESPVSGISYYRLKQMDFDGHTSYSNLEKVNIDHKVTALNFDVYPNPINNNSINLFLSSETNNDFMVAVYDILGNKVFSKAIITLNEDNSYPVDLEQQLHPGIYLITVTSDQGSESKRVIVN